MTRACTLFAVLSLVGSPVGCAMDVGGPAPADPTGAPFNDPGAPFPAPGEGEGEGAVGEGEGEGGEGGGEGEGEGEGEGDDSTPDPCPAVDPCSAAPSVTVIFSSAGANPTVTASGQPAIAIAASRATASGALTPNGISDADNPYRVRSCTTGLTLQYVDTDGVFDEFVAAPADAVARVIAGADARATYGDVTVGAPLPAGVAGARSTIAGGAVLFQAAEGMEILLDANDVVVGLVAFKPQTAAHWDLPLTLTSTGGSLGSLTTGSSTFGDAASVLGSAYDSQGVATVTVGFLDADVLIRSWSSIGVRIAGVCSGSCGNGANITISSITITPPFLGKDGTVGIGAARAAVDDLVGVNGQPDAHGVVVYGPSDLGDSPLGVAYLQDTQCAERAATFIVGYVSL